jgi:hypothetical protein
VCARARALILLGLIAAATLVPPVGRAVGGRYAFAGGTPHQQSEVRRALAASSFDWSVVPARITIHIAPVPTSFAVPGAIWLDTALLNAGALAWGVVQHEYAHQIDFFLLRDGSRSLLQRELDATAWCPDVPVGRDSLGCERFASAVAWAYWPSPDNVMRTSVPHALSAARFRSVLNGVLSQGGRYAQLD